MVCGHGEKVEKWQPEYEKMRQPEGKAPYICNDCLTKVHAEHHAKLKKSAT